MCEVLDARSRPTVCEPMDCSPPGPSVLGILQVRILKRVDIPVSRGIFLTRGSNLEIEPRSPELEAISLRYELPGKLQGSLVGATALGVGYFWPFAVESG